MSDQLGIVIGLMIGWIVGSVIGQLLTQLVIIPLIERAFRRRSWLKADQ